MILNVELENQFGINYYLTLIIFCVVLFHKEKIKMKNGKSMLELSSRKFYSIICRFFWGHRRTFKLILEL